LVLWLYSKRRRFDGEIFLMYLIWYGVERAIVEGLRTDSLLWGKLRVSQVLAVTLVVVAFVILTVMRSKIKTAHDPEFKKPYGNTEEFKAEYEAYQQKLKEKENKKKGKKNDDVESVVIEEAAAEETKAPAEETPAAEEAPAEEPAEE